MNFAYRLVGDALADLKQLDVWLQEEVLDELDLACATAAHRGDDAEVTHDFERRFQNKRHVVFLRMRVDRRRGVLIVLGIASVTTPLSA